MISWKHSFNKLNEEYSIAKKKKQALDNLLDSGKISQSTHELVSREIDDALADIEKQQRALLEKMNSKIVELEGQIRTLEMLLANSEIRHVTGEVDEEVYQRESTLLSMGLDAARQELSLMQDAVNQLSQGNFVKVKLQFNENETSQEQSHEALKNVDVQESAKANVESEEKQGM